MRVNALVYDLRVKEVVPHAVSPLNDYIVMVNLVLVVVGLIGCFSPSKDSVRLDVRDPTLVWLIESMLLLCGAENFLKCLICLRTEKHICGVS